MNTANITYNDIVTVMLVVYVIYLNIRLGTITTFMYAIDDQLDGVMGMIISWIKNGNFPSKTKGE